LLGARLSHDTAEGTVTVRVTEVEAYLGEFDPGSHAFRGRTKRTEVMFGRPGHLYTYFTYGMHVCANVVCSPEGTASAVLIRAGEVVEGHDLARQRRHTSKVAADLARGPARLVVALGISLDDGGADLLGGGPLRLELPARSAIDYSSGPRTGVSGDGGTDAFPWRFWITGDPTVSPYKKSAPKKRTETTAR
jgi:DNA-3-methyladenine glycosylase